MLFTSILHKEDNISDTIVVAADTDGVSKVGPLSMDIDRLSETLGGSGRALLTWDCLRIGIDPTLFFNSRISDEYLDGSVWSCISDIMMQQTAVPTASPSNDNNKFDYERISTTTREDIRMYLPQRRITQTLGLKTLEQLSTMYSYSPPPSSKQPVVSTSSSWSPMSSLEYTIASLQQIQISSDGTTKLLLRLASDGALVESVIIPVFPAAAVNPISSTTSTMHNPTRDMSREEEEESTHTHTPIITSTTPRSTLCVSSQVGCRQACTFCATGRMGKLRDLTSDEILIQLYYANKIVRVFQTLLLQHPQQQQLTVHQQEEVNSQQLSSSSYFHSFLPPLPEVDNIVFMGMGEASDNAQAVLRATRIMTHPRLFGFGQTKVTISTVGPTPQAFHILGQASAILAWSVHAVRDSLRKQLVPTTKYPMKELRQGLIDTLIHRPHKLQTIMWQITLIENVNDSLVEADELATFALEMIQAIPRMKLIVNLIPWNDILGQEPYSSSSSGGMAMKYRKPSMERIRIFQNHLIQRGLVSYIRTTRGDDESAACGQLATINTKKEKNRIVQSSQVLMTTTTTTTVP